MRSPADNRRFRDDPLLRIGTTVMALALALALAAVAAVAYWGSESETAVASETATRTSAEPLVRSDPPHEAWQEKAPARPPPEPEEESPASARADRTVPADEERESDGGRDRSRRPRDAAEETPERPNIVVVLTDDLDTGSISHMPKLRSSLVEKGTSFDNAFVTDPMCCPARATFLRGQYPHNTKITGNAPPLGGHEKFRRLGLERSTLATWLDDAGYETFYAGKYMNGYDGTRHVPPGWDEWFGWLGNYHSPGGKYRLNENGRIRRYDLDRTHDTDLLKEKATSFMEDRKDADRPFFMYVAPNAPHAPAYVPRRHEGMFSKKPLPSTPSMGEKDISDKPAWLRGKGRLDRDEREWTENFYRKRLAALQSVDDMVGAFIETLRETGQLDTTYVVFTSDNGFLFGEHHRTRKSLAYEESIGVPLIVRGPGVPTRELDHLVINNDLAPTIADLADVRPPDFVDGRSFVPLLRRAGLEEQDWRTGFLVEHAIPDYRAIRTERHTYVEWDDGERELYDLSEDPHQLRSIHETAGRSLLANLENRLEGLESCAREGCRAAENGR